MRVAPWALVLTACVVGARADMLPPTMYCGRDNCYELLGVERDASTRAITKAYRGLASKHHPDRQRTATDEQRLTATHTFQKIANAYETLKDADSRRDYDYMLDNPEQMYYHYYAYYRRQMAPKVDVRLVIAGTILAISIFQYVSAHQMHQSMVNYLLQEYKSRSEAETIARERGLLMDKDAAKGKGRLDKQAVKEHNEQVLRAVIEEQGAHRRPTVRKTLLGVLACLPYTSAMYVYWWARWVYLFDVKRQAYGDEEKAYLIRKHMQLTEQQYDLIPDAQHDEMWQREIWLKPNADAYKQEKSEEAKIKLAQSGKHKMYRRWMKNNSNSRMTFMED